eukprot:Phypoly_transcript_05038.p1 GENE.Phypoly_transcript_05038~~Phypoly_transcript_05038.p1  ORF type:complete len:587 (-),score=75.16 Phypoly_transcript_05038:164-1924(-)
MDDPIAMPIDGKAKQEMQAGIKQKLSEITGSQVDDVLPEYVMVMVANHKSKGQVASDLEAFLGPDQSQTFTAWLWDALHAMSSDATSRKQEIKRQPREEDEDRSRGRERDRDTRGRDTKREPSPSRSVFASVITVPQNTERHRTSIDNPAPARLILSAVQDAVRSTSVSVPVRAVDITERERESERDRQRGRDRDYGRDRDRDSRDNRDNRDREYNTRDRGYNGRDRSDRDRPRDGVFDRLGSRDSDMEDIRRSREEKRPLRASREKEYNLSPSLSSRLGTPSTSAPTHADTTVFLPDTPAGSTRKIEGEGEEDPVTFTVTLNGVKDDPEEAVSKPLRNKRRVEETDEMEEDTVVESVGKKIKKEKCQYWPNCKRGDECAYFHPTQKCKLFPDCPFADKCLYIHPSVPCKFGAKCARPDCAYSHPAPSSLSLSGTYPTSTFAPKGTLSVNTALPTGLGVGPSKFAPVHGAGVKPCKHGFACPRDGCTFFHPPNACVYGDACARPGCAFAHGKMCRSGIACSTPGCSFVHAPIIKTPCKFGAGCLNNSCRFQHDVPPKSIDASMADADDTSLMSASLPRTPPRVAAV